MPEAPAHRGFFYKGKTLLSAVDPTGRAQRLAGAVEVRERTLYFCPSPLYGYGLERLLERLSAVADSAVLCIEADSELFALSSSSFGAALHASPKLRLTNATDPAALCVLVRQAWGARVFRRVETLRLSGGWQLFPELYESLADILRREIGLEWGNALTLAKLGRRYIRNALRNLALVPRCPSIESLSFGNAPVLVLGAGPSLDETLDILPRRFGERVGNPSARPFKIICVDTCLPALRGRGITPDLAVVLESQHWNLRDFTGCAGWQVPAAVDFSALPQSARVLGGECFLFMTPWTGLRIFERLKAAGLLPAQFAPLGSVGLSAVEIARHLTGGKIVVCGIDFSFTLDSYHARSTPGHRQKLAACNRFGSLLNAAAVCSAATTAEVSKSGSAVRSSPAMRNYRSLFEREFAADPRLFDTAGSGLSLGLKTLSLGEACDLLCGAGGNAPPLSAPQPQAQLQSQSALAAQLRAAAHAELGRLAALRSLLTGGAQPSAGQLDALIDECDYLWGHFPDYAASGGRRPAESELAAKSPAALSFLKRLRAEIDPFVALWELTLKSL